MKLFLQPLAEHRIRAVVLSIGIKFGRRAAEQFHAELGEALRRIARFPRSGSRLPDHPDSDARQVIVAKRYRVFYFVDTKRRALWVVDIWHTAQLAARPLLPLELGGSSRS